MSQVRGRFPGDAGRDSRRAPGAVPEVRLCLASLRGRARHRRASQAAARAGL